MLCLLVCLFGAVGCVTSSSVARPSFFALAKPRPCPWVQSHQGHRRNANQPLRNHVNDIPAASMTGLWPSGPVLRATQPTRESAQGARGRRANVRSAFGAWLVGGKRGRGATVHGTVGLRQPRVAVNIRRGQHAPRPCSARIPLGPAPASGGGGAGTRVRGSLLTTTIRARAVAPPDACRGSTALRTRTCDQRSSRRLTAFGPAETRDSCHTTWLKRRKR